MIYYNHSPMLKVHLLFMSTAAVKQIIYSLWLIIIPIQSSFQMRIIINLRLTMQILDDKISDHDLGNDIFSYN